MDPDKVDAVVVKTIKACEDYMNEQIEKVADAEYQHFMKRKLMILKDYGKIGGDLQNI